mmetsp:Transcript_11169/g.24090  ORF Transcript_11169/g.24090 Transcript_11169/m.24090 type:complete len:293 (+) Transcript_11169:38-916(+)
MIVVRQSARFDVELWLPATAECFFVPRDEGNGRSILSCCRRREEQATDRQATPNCSVRKILFLFSSDNVWINCQPDLPMSKLDFRIRGNAKRWKPLFTDSERQRLFGAAGKISTAADVATPLNFGIGAGDWDGRALRVQEQLSRQLSEKIIHYRLSAEGGHRDTDLNFHAAEKMVAVLEELEEFKRAQRVTGAESCIGHLGVPRVAAPTSDAIQACCDSVRNLLGWHSFEVTGVPMHFAYTDFDAIWQAVRNSNILTVGENRAKYVCAVRVFPYPAKVLSVWVFIVCAAKES